MMMLLFLSLLYFADVVVAAAAVAVVFAAADSAAVVNQTYFIFTLPSIYYKSCYVKTFRNDHAVSVCGILLCAIWGGGRLDKTVL